MRFSDFSKKEVVNIRDGKCLGCVYDLVFDECRGQIQAIVLKGPARWFHCVGYDSEYVIGWECIVRIGPDVILVEVCAEKVLKKI